MRDRPLIVGGLIVFLGLVTFPVWYNLAQGTLPRGPDLKLPAGQKECVAPIAYMKSSHMQLLIEWREGVVRNNTRTVTAYNGKQYDASLTRTCLQRCHAPQPAQTAQAAAPAGQADFCGKCHDYAGVAPTCWNCHVEMKPAPGGRVIASLSHQPSVIRHQAEGK